MSIFLLVVLFAIISFCSSSYRHSHSRSNFTIGGLFNQDNSDVKLAFKCTAQWYDYYTDEGAVYNTIIQTVPENNIFAASKIICNILRNNKIITMFGPEGLRSSAMTQSICNKLQIPHIETSWQPSLSYPSSNSVNLFPAAHLLAEGFETILRHMNWKSYAIIYQRDEALIRLQGILKIPTIPNNPVIVKQIESVSDCRSLFKILKNLHISNIILDCDTDDILNILQQAKEVKLLNYPASYLLTSLDAHTVDYSILNTSANITVVRLFDPSNENLVRHVQSWEMGEMGSLYSVRNRLKNVRTEAVLTIDAVNLLINTVNSISKNKTVKPRFLACDRKDTWKNGLEVVAHMKKQQLQDSLTGFIAFDQFGQRINFTLQIFELSSNLLKATWSPVNGKTLNITITAEEQKQLMLQSLQRQRIVISTKLVHPYLMLRNKSDSGDNSESVYEGYAADLMDLIAQELNFTYEFYLNPLNVNGNYDDNLRKWTGVVGDVVYGVAQLGICDLTVTHQRRQAVDFSNHFMTLGISILYRKPDPGKTNMFAFIDPLSEDVWMYTVTAYLGVSILLYLTARLAPNDWENPNPLDDDPEELENVWNLGNALWVNIGSLMTLGCDIMPKSGSSRLLVAMWWFFSLLITSSYTANMAAYLARGRMASKINNVDDLIAQNKIKFGTLINGTTYDFFRKSNYSKYQAVWNKMSNFKPSTFVSSNEEGVRKVLNIKQDYAFLMESSSLDYEINKHCELTDIGNWLDSKGYGIAMPIDAPYRGEINNAILKFQESGSLQALKNKWWIEKNIGDNCEEDDEQPDDGSLNLTNVGGIFLVLGIGVVISFFIAIMEFLWNVRSISVEEKITYWEALVVEFKFAVNIWVTKKATKAEASKLSKSRAVSETRSNVERVIHSAASLLHLDNILEQVSSRKSNARQS